MDEEDKDLKIIKNHVAMLSEHFDTVQIFVTNYDGETKETMNGNYGIGNYFARLGQIITWLETQENQIVKDENKDYQV